MKELLLRTSVNAVLFFIHICTGLVSNTQVFVFHLQCAITEVDCCNVISSSPFIITNLAKNIFSNLFTSAGSIGRVD